MEYEDPKINVDPGKAKTIAQVICEEIKTSIEKNKSTYDLAVRCERQYSQVTNAMALNRTVESPWRNAADYFIPMTEWIIDAIHARVMSILFSQEPYMEATGVEALDIEKAAGVTDFVDMVWREKIRIYDNTNFFWKQMIKLPFAVLKYDIVKDFEPMITRESAMAFMNPQTQEKKHLLQDDPETPVMVQQFMAEGFQPIGQEDVWAQQEHPLHDGPKLKYVIFSDYVWSPNAKRGTRLYWEGDRDWMTINEINVKVQQGRFSKDAFVAIKNNANFNSKEGVDKIIAQRSDLRECFHWYGRLPFNKNNEVDFNDPDAFEQEVYCYLDYGAQELLEISHWYHRRIPHPDRVYIRGEFEETENFIGRSMCMKLYMTQKELNALHNTIMNNAWIAMQKIFVKKRTLTGEDWENPTVYPGAIWEEDMQGDVRVLEMGDVKAVGFEIEQTLLNFAERLSNISLFQTGTARTEGGQKTLGEVEKTIQEGNVGLDKFIQNCHNIMRKIAQWTVDYYYEYMPVGLERRIRGETGDTIFPTQDNMGLYQEQGIRPEWSKDDLAGQFDYTFKATSLNANKEWNLAVANDLMDKMLPQPMIGQTLIYTWEILKTNFLARGIKDWQKYMPSREAVMQEMQRMYQESQTQTAGRADPAAQNILNKIKSGSRERTLTNV